MAKNRKTRKEKIRATQRLASTPTSSLENTQATSEDRTTFSFTSTASHANTAHKATTTALSTHLREDLLRTGIVTGAIVLAELILFYTLSLR